MTPPLPYTAPCIQDDAGVPHVPALPLRPEFATFRCRMKTLSHADRAFIEHRRAQKSTGLIVFPIALVVLVLVWVGLYVWWPTMMNPLAAYREFGRTSTDLCPIADQAAVKSLFLNITFGLVGLVVVRGISFALVERRYRRLLDALVEAPEAALESPPSAAIHRD